MPKHRVLFSSTPERKTPNRSRKEAPESLYHLNHRRINRRTDADLHRGKKEFAEASVEESNTGAEYGNAPDNSSVLGCPDFIPCGLEKALLRTARDDDTLSGGHGFSVR